MYDPTDPVGRLLFNVLAMVAELESDLIRLRTREGMKVEKAPPLLLHSLYTGDAAPQNLMTAKTGSFRYPRQVYEQGPQPASPQVKSPLRTWWQVKDSNLRSFRDGFTDQRQQARDQPRRLSLDNFRAYSPQTADNGWLQPDPSEQFAFTATRRDVEPDATRPVCPPCLRQTRAQRDVDDSRTKCGVGHRHHLLVCVLRRGPVESTAAPATTAAMASATAL